MRSSSSNIQTQGQWPLRLIDGIADTLAAISDENLHGLRAMLNEQTITVPALLAWLNAAIDGELTSRRAGNGPALPDPRVTIRTQGAREASLALLVVLHAQLRDAEGVTDFLDATAEVLCTSEGDSPAMHLH